ncbi:MAG: acyl-CoA dehydrogenase family protein [Methylovirgula sp.]
MTVQNVHLREAQGEETATNARADLASRGARVVEVAAAHAASVDVEARFPTAAIEAMREGGLLSLMVPQDLGGEGLPLSAIADVCYTLGQACSATAMIFAMHHSAAACVIRHAGASAWHRDFLRQIANAQLLLASSTTEGQNGGNVRASAAAIEGSGDSITLDRAATVISYGAEADAIVTTARRADDAPSSDQILVTFVKGDYTLERLSGWNALGMRGTASAGFTLKARGDRAQILPEPYERVHAQTMQPVSHLLWASVWAGIAASAVGRAQAFIRKAARQSGGALPPGAAHYTKARSTLQMLCALITSSLTRFEAVADDPKALGALDFQTAITLTKVDASELAVATVLSAMRVAGLAGYRNDGDYTLGRHLRDILSAPIMINNDRILANVSTAALMGSVPSSLRGES